MMIHNIDDVEHMALEFGFLPFFRCRVEGLSVEEHVPSELWFNDECDGPWEWKGPLIARGSLAYGKLYGGRAGFVSMRWLPHLLNYRRSAIAYPHNEAEREVLETISARESMLTHEVKRECGFNPGRPPRLSPLEKALLAEQGRKPERPPARNRGFETIMTRLQMGLRLVVADFEYRYAPDGHRYTWGMARFTTPELMYGDDLPPAGCSPGESLSLMVDHLCRTASCGEDEARRLIEV